MKHLILILAFLLSFLIVNVSCSNEQEFTQTIIEENTKVIEEELIEEPEEKLTEENSIELPEDFDWENIPDSYNNYTYWVITHTHNLEGNTITLPEGITLYFKHGQLQNGTITGTENGIYTEHFEQVFNSIDLAGTYTNEYLKPYWFGAAMDGTTDDRDAFVETITQSNHINAKVLIEKDMFLDVEETGRKSIFLPSNTTLEGVNNASLTINNELSPAFIIALEKNISIKNLSILLDQSYDATTAPTVGDKILNQNQLENYLVTNHNIIFTAAAPIWRGSQTMRAIFFLAAPSNISFENIELKAVGETANEFIYWGVKLKEEFAPNQDITSYSGANVIIPSDITFQNFSLDGYLMGIQGTGENLYFEGTRGYRYSDAQTETGTNIGHTLDGETIGLLSPPHLFYINEDDSIHNNLPTNITITNTIDYGQYVGAEPLRGDGYCGSLKLVEGVTNAYVYDYQSYRRDGVADFGNLQGAHIEKIYAEYDSSISNPEDKFNSVRWLDDGIHLENNNVVFKDIILKDNANVSNIYPLDFMQGSNNTWEDVHVFVKTITNTPLGFFGIFGSNNTIKKCSLNIENHIDLNNMNRGPIFHDENTLENGKNNNYEIIVNGWREISQNPLNLAPRIIFANKSNSNNNYAKIEDTTNDYVIEQINNEKTHYWKKEEVVALGAEDHVLLNLKFPLNYKIESFTIEALEELEPGSTFSVGTGWNSKEDLIATLNNITGKISPSINAINNGYEDKSIYIFGNQNFNNVGKLKINITFSFEAFKQ